MASAWVARRDAGLSAAEEAEWQAWLATDPRHREAYDRYAALWVRLDRPRAAGAGTRLQRDVALAGRARHRARRRAAGAAVALWGVRRLRGADHACLRLSLLFFMLMNLRWVLPGGC